MQSDQTTSTSTAVHNIGQEVSQEVTFATNSPYFAPLLPWQRQGWQQLTARQHRLPHGLLFSGMKGIGKRAFVWRFTAWLLCLNAHQSSDAACGRCQSCLWLCAGTHPDLKVLPQSSLLLGVDKDTESQNQYTATIKRDKGKRKTPPKEASSSIKIDDIRALQPFIEQGSTGRRVCVIDNADALTLAAANALLKTLEEPREGVFLFLITDTPTKLLPTIKSRVQHVAIDHMARDPALRAQVVEFLAAQVLQNPSIELNISSELIPNLDTNRSSVANANPSNSRLSEADKDRLLDKHAVITQHITQAMSLTNGAPLAALDLLESEWYGHRTLWVKTWLALRQGKRSVTAASHYWQSLIAFEDFLTLSELMLIDFGRIAVGMRALQADIGLENYTDINKLSIESIHHIVSIMDDIKLALQQNVQDKWAYDTLLSAIQKL